MDIKRRKRQPQHAWPSTRLSLLEEIRREQAPLAWRKFVDSYRPLIYRYCRRRGLQDADALDVVQNVFCRVRNALPTFEYSRKLGRFRGWLGTITFREIRQVRHRAERDLGQQLDVEQLGEDSCEVSGDDGVWVDEFNAHILGLALERIRPEFDSDVWDVFERVWLRSKPPAVVAAETAKGPAWVYKAKFRALKRLKQEIEYLSEDVAFLHR